MRFDSEQFQDNRVVSGGGTRYFLVCETCQERVTRTRRAWRSSLSRRTTRPSGICESYKGACDIYGSEPHVRWLELDRFLLCLVQNSTEGLRTALENVEHRREWGLEAEGLIRRIPSEGSDGAGTRQSARTDPSISFQV